jgi:hypothetical protein
MHSRLREVALPIVREYKCEIHQLEHAGRLRAETAKGAFRKVKICERGLGRRQVRPDPKYGRSLAGLLQREAFENCHSLRVNEVSTLSYSESERVYVICLSFCHNHEIKCSAHEVWFRRISRSLVVRGLGSGCSLCFVVQKYEGLSMSFRTGDGVGGYSFHLFVRLISDRAMLNR